MQSLYAVPFVYNFTLTNQRAISKVTHDNKSSILSVIMSHIHNTVKYICMQFFLALSDNLTNLYIYIYYAMLSHFSHVQLCVTP